MARCRVPAAGSPEGSPWPCAPHSSVRGTSGLAFGPGGNLLAAQASPPVLWSVVAVSGGGNGSESGGVGALPLVSLAGGAHANATLDDVATTPGGVT
jgi:hypothetical protein